MSAAPVNMRFEPARGLSGKLRAPADKSISHRAALLGAMASEPVRIQRYLHAADTTSTLRAVEALGALVELRSDGEVIVRGTGLREAREPEAPIDVGNAGTLMRLLPGWLAAQEGRAFTLDGDASIRRRPVDRIAEPLRRMGADLQATEGRFPPLQVRGARLHAIDYEMQVASAQVKSCVLLAALLAEGETTIEEPVRSRDHTERMLLRAGVVISRAAGRVSVLGADELLLEGVRVPGDPSSAAFMIAAGVLVPGSRLLIGDVGVNWTRTGFLRIVRRMQGIVLGDLEPEGFKHCDQTAQATLVVEPGSVVRELFVTHEARHGLVVHSAGPLVRGTVQDGRVAMTTRIRSATSRQALDHGAGSKKPTSAMAAARCRDPARAKGPLLAVTGAFPHRRGHSTWNSRSRLRAARCQPHMKREAASFAPFACGREACGSWHLLRTASAHDELRVADRGVSP